MLFATTLVALLLVFLGVSGRLPPFQKHLPSSSYLAAERHAVALVPPGAGVSATQYLAAHLAEREHFYVFPVIARADWVVVESHDDWLPNLGWLKARKGIQVGAHDLYQQPGLIRRTLRRLERSPAWTLVFQSQGVRVFRRVHPAGTS